MLNVEVGRMSKGNAVASMNLRRARRVGLMTAAQFKRAADGFLRLSSQGRAVARSVLVDGVTQAEVAENRQLHRQQVSRWVNKIYGAHLAVTGGHDEKRKGK